MPQIIWTYIFEKRKKYIQQLNGKDVRIYSLRQEDLCLIYYTMNKKGVLLGKQCDQKLSKICQKAYQNQLNLQTFYRTNNLKFPPLFRSKNLVMSSVEKPKAQAQLLGFDRIQNSSELKYEKDSGQKQSFGKNKPSICPIIFKRIKARKDSQIVHATRNNFNVSRTIEIDRDVNKSKLKTPERKTLKFINQAPKNSLSTILDSFYTNRSKLDSSQREIAQQQRNYQNADYWKAQLNGSIVVNNAMTPNPQNLFLQSINQSRTNLLSTERQLIVKRQTKLDLKRISIYKHANGLFSNRKKKLDISSEANKFQPWQMSNPEDEIAIDGEFTQVNIFKK